MDTRFPSTSETAVNHNPDVNSSDNSSSQLNSLNAGNSKLAKPLHLQRLEKALRLDGLLKQVEETLSDKSVDETSNPTITKQQLKAAKTRIYNLSKVKKNKKWLKNILLDKSDSSESEFESEAAEEECIRDMIRFHKMEKKARREFEGDFHTRQYQNYSTSLLASSQQSVSLLSHNNNSNSSCLNNNSNNNAPKKSTNKLSNKPQTSKKSKIVISASAIPTATVSPMFAQELKDSMIGTRITDSPDVSCEVEVHAKTIDPQETKFDPTLMPEDVLRSESFTYTDAIASCSYSLNETVSTQLPDDIFDTEESSGSVLSQSLSLQTTPTRPLVSFALPKCSTAPVTPTSSPTSPLIPVKKEKTKSSKKKSVASQEAINQMKRKRLWISIAKKEIPRAQKQIIAARKEAITNAKRMSTWCQREKRKSTLVFQKQFCRDQFRRAKCLTREMLLYWKRFDKVEKDYRKRAEKEAQEQMRIDYEMIEARRQQRKLNFLITQTELYAHFMSRKLTNMPQKEQIIQQDMILSQLNDECPVVLASGVTDDYDADVKKREALENADSALKVHQENACQFDTDLSHDLSHPNMIGSDEMSQPDMFRGTLKSYQIKGMNWLYNLYDKGINGILADEMGLGKTIQTIAFLALIAEKLKVWGPFLIIAPSSTLHNWQQEFSRFVPKFKVLPYWGNPIDRKVLRKSWNDKYLPNEEASFHVLVTSYQLVVQDVKYFQRIKWMYMVLDEAQAIKSTSSVRWKLLLQFNCRNRLLLTGTPIQNTMAELWALLHFIMPTLFDSHDEFNEWFSKDIESHAENKTIIDEKHLSRLHMILKPFMLRRIKKDVENELSDKIEIKLYCGLTRRQQMLYKALKNKISIDDLMLSSSSGSSGSTSNTSISNLMNLVMQFRKVCNHPDLFERREVRSPFHMQLDAFTLPRLLFDDGLCHDYYRYDAMKSKLLFQLLSIFSCDYIVNSLSNQDSCFSFIKFIPFSPGELNRFIMGDLLDKWQFLVDLMEWEINKSHKVIWSHDEDNNDISREPLMVPLKTTYFKHNKKFSSDSNDLWSNLLFNWNFTYNRIYAFNKHKLHYKHETAEHREMRLRKFTESIDEQMSIEESEELNNQNREQLLAGFTQVKHKSRSPEEFDCEQTRLPSFLFTAIQGTNGLKVNASVRDVFCSNQRAILLQNLAKQGGSNQIHHLIIHGDISHCHLYPHHINNLNKKLFFPQSLSGTLACKPANGWSSIIIPDKETLVTDSGKLYALDDLLSRLKEEGHRVLIYSQMTRMIDLLEEYMWHAKHTYMRLDGSSRIADRRDMVDDFQTRSDIFVFLLSTRAGGLGINLTAADTVIFFDSDWNPTVDQQAMDRAHRLGQTKQVTVYRLVCKNTIEERILQRAKEKSEIQRMVISGGTFRPDTLKPTEVVSLLLDDDELERKFKCKQEEKMKQLEENPESGKKTPVKRSFAINMKKDPSQPKRKYTKRNKTDTSIEPSVNFIERLPVRPESEMDSCPASPLSENSVNSLVIVQDDDESNEGALIVDDGSPCPSRNSSTPDFQSPSSTPIKRGTGRSRGRPRGSRARGPIAPRGRGSTAGAAALAAAERAGAQAGKSAALAAYPFLENSLSGESTGTITRRGRGRGRSRMGLIMNQGNTLASTSSTQLTSSLETDQEMEGYYVQQKDDT